MRRSNGFTLIELMVTVVIIAVLAAVAVPMYADYVTRSKIAEATSALADARVRMEQYFLDNRTYVAAGACGAALGNGKYFNLTCAADATTYTVTATGGAGADTSMKDFVYTIDQANNRRTTKTKWGDANVNCWITKKGVC